MPTATKGNAAREVEVVIVGAGPVGLTIANYLGIYGVSAIVIEQLPDLIDYPRAIGLDDEALRTMQAIGVADLIAPHTTPLHWMRFLTAKGRCWATIEPRSDEFGWSRRNAFIQPQADRILYESLSRFSNVEVVFDAKLKGFTQDASGVSVETESGMLIRASYLVGCDGGRSPVREALGLTFDGKTAPNQWIVVDVEDDPIGTPNIYLGCDPKRPYVSAALPHGIRRFEFMVMPGETEEHFREPGVMEGLLAKLVDKPGEVKVIRQRVYNHNSRLASRFRVDRVLLAGDAAHIMPVWQGQGYNSGIRDASNLGWKLAMVAKGQLAPALLDSYETERRAHAKAMIDLSVMVGKVFNPPYRWLGTLRDGVTLVLNAFPAVKRYFLEMRFKPMPRFDRGAIVPSPVERKNSPVGRLFIQPQVRRGDGSVCRFDDVVGPNFAVVSWATNPACYLDAAERARWEKLGAVFISVKPDIQLGARPDPALGFSAGDLAGVVEVGDLQGRFKEWFGRHPESVVFLRPDRVVAAMCTPQRVTETSQALASAISCPNGA